MCRAGSLLFSLCLCGTLLAGCASKTPIFQGPISSQTDLSQTENYKNYIISVDEQGQPIDPISGKAYDNMEEFYTHIASVLGAKKNKIVIYIHGGLNRSKDKRERVKNLTPRILADDYHPIFINWRSDFYSSFLEHLFKLRRGEHRPYMGLITAPFVFLEDLAKGVSHTPLTFWDKYLSFSRSPIKHGLNPHDKKSTYLTGHPVLRMLYRKEINAYLINELASEQDDSTKGPFVNVVRFEDERSPWQIAKETLSLYLVNLATAVTAPISDTFGKGAWDVMKRRTEVMFTKPMTHDAERYKSIEEYSQAREGALSKFFDALQEKQKNNGLEILLVGHSMGTIIANTILQKWPEIKYSRIIYMAAACSIQDFEISVVPYLRKNSDTKFTNYTLHPIAERLEAKEINFLGFRVRGTETILNYIDNYYADSVSENQWVLGKWINVMNNIDYFYTEEEIKNRIYLRTMPYDNKCPTKHEQFDDPKFLDTWQFWDGNHCSS